MAHTPLRAHAPAHPWSRLAKLVALTASCLAVFTAAAQANGGLELTSRPAADDAAANTAAVLGQFFPKVVDKPAYITVWEGRDVDGDGAADFANPTGKAPRVHDAYGDGHFGASRDGGAREHEGVDYVAEAGQSVAAPISGFVSKIGYTYGDDDRFRYIEITNPALGYEARVFYVDPTVQVGQAVRVGSQIGTVLSLQGRYAGITDHVHLEIAAPAQGRVDATRLIALRTVPLRGRG